MKKAAWLFLVILGCGRLWAETLYVDLASPAPAAPFSSMESAATNIQDAVDASADGDIIRIADGHYLLSAEISVTKAITLQSVNGPESTVVDGQGIARCLNLGNYACVIEGLTITNGYADSTARYGGGIYCLDTTPVVTNCTISGNSAESGGGMYGGTANNCTISGNSTSGVGGGMFFGTANNCTISGNSADLGGGMNGGTANNCTISGNSAGDDGGGMRFGTANNCIVWNNDARSGNDLYFVTANYSCSPDVTHGVDGNMTNAPLLVSWSHIATNSPCRGAGITNYVSGTDIDGEAWLNPPSMGCDEYHGSVSGPLNVSFSCSATEFASFWSVSFSEETAGAAFRLVWDFGDGIRVANALGIRHVWSCPGNYEVVLTAFNDTWPDGVSATQLVSVVSAEERAVYVAPQGDDINDGLSWATAKQTIQAGIDAQALAGGWILVSNGVYAVTNEIVVNKQIIVRGVNGPESTVVDGQGVSRCFNLGESACVIEGLTITNGYSMSGSGIYCSDTTPVITNCTISGNLAYSGGGMGGGTAHNCTISGNSADYGGGMSGGTANNCTISGNSASERGGGMVEGTANNCTISGNSASDGGGMWFGTANNCTISLNTASDDGGGIYEGTANNCTISWNLADGGGGMYYGTANNCTISVNSAKAAGGMAEGTANNCTISGNSASDGGGMRKGTANNCTISGNSASRYGGGMFFGTANNCIVWNNEAPTGNDLYSATVNYTCSPDVTHGVSGNITTAPGFVDYEHGDYRLMSNSPCINWGDNASVSGSVDLDGNPRIVDGYIDMGAYEFQGTPVADRDADGMDDSWERDLLGYNADADDDDDGDAYCNEAEFIAGTDPMDSYSVFAMTNAYPASGFVVEWTAIPDRYYKVLWQPGLTNAAEVLQDYLEYPQNSYTDTVHDAESAGFYQIEVRLK